VAAKYNLMVDYHGAFKPAGLRSAYPNVMSYEGVMGNENNKWGRDITPDHNLTLPFTRMVAGPMDYTPGAMANAQQKNFNISFDRPMSQGTRCHQVAMYVVFESPLQMLCDAPSAYLKDKNTAAFISQIPSVWDETRVLEGKIGDYIVLARRKGKDWYVGAMTDWTERSFDLDLSFLSEGAFEMSVIKDGVNADKYAEDYQLSQQNVDRQSKVKIEMAPGGGWAAILKLK
jgi:alpha-glucosidase